MRLIFLKGILYVLIAFIILQGLFVVFVLVGGFGKIPDIKELKQIQNPIATEIYTADGVLMGTYNIENRQYLDPSEIPESIRNALIATEDVRFYKHKGIDPRSLFRVFFKTLLLRKEGSGGGSTLSQQLAKNLYPRRNEGAFSMPVIKVKEMAVARRMEKVYTKDEILEMYLSTVPFGENTFGIKAASRRFFNKEPEELKPEESAVLVGMLKATGSYNPVRHPERARTRRNVVLEQMARYAYLEETEADSLQETPLELDYHPLPHNAGIAPYFREFIRAELDQWCREYIKSGSEPYNLYTDGLKVYTTIDSRLQGYAEEAMKSHMAHLQKMFEKQWSGEDLWKGLTEKQILINFDGEYREGMASEEARKMEVFTWEGLQEKDYRTLDSIKHYLQYLQAGFLAMDVKTAEIRAWVGGINYQYFKFDHVRAKRQAGSTFKALVYLEALEQGFSPCDYYPNDSVVYEEYNNWTPQNADHAYGGYYSMNGALVHSVNTVSVDLLMQVGIDSVLELSQKAGINSPLPAVPSLALGTGDVSLFEMVGVYQAIANMGIYKEPVYISRIEDASGKVLEERIPDSQGTAICTPGNAGIMIEMLRGVVNNGTAAGLRMKYGILEDIAGKTGTTQKYTDGWFIGFTPGLVAGAWVGGDLQNVRFQNMAYGQGAYTALPIWAGFMKSSFRDEHWSSLRADTFRIHPDTRELLQCDDYKDKKPFQFRPFRELKEKRIFRNLFRRKRK
ncbi:MAG: transglycosylase domain-containing protein [Bacteroidales bacterium]|nr:transglycosylase domain-containing protein [Bacteroidales bacterium]